MFLNKFYNLQNKHNIITANNNKEIKILIKIIIYNLLDKYDNIFILGAEKEFYQRFLNILNGDIMNFNKLNENFFDCINKKIIYVNYDGQIELFIASKNFLEYIQDINKKILIVMDNIVLNKIINLGNVDEFFKNINFYNEHIVKNIINNKKNINFVFSLFNFSENLNNIAKIYDLFPKNESFNFFYYYKKELNNIKKLLAKLNITNINFEELNTNNLLLINNNTCNLIDFKINDYNPYKFLCLYNEKINNEWNSYKKLIQKKVNDNNLDNLLWNELNKKNFKKFYNKYKLFHL